MKHLFTVTATQATAPDIPMQITPTATPSPTPTPTATPRPTPTPMPKPVPTQAPVQQSVQQQQPVQQPGPPAQPAPPPLPASSGGDKDCKDFATQEQAQDYFNSKGGSPSNNVDDLDADHDGIACESLP